MTNTLKTINALPDLLPCPFCGSTASFTEDNSPIRDNKTVWLVGCDSEDCPAMPLLCGNARKIDAATAWNSRAASLRWTRVENGNEPHGPVWVTHGRWNEVTLAYFAHGVRAWYTRDLSDDRIPDVKAWMPIPEPLPFMEEQDEQR